MAWTNLLGQVRVGVRGSIATPVSQSLLLDTWVGAAAAYSLRKLNSSYTGSAIRVRRSSDNSEQNIGFNADGTLNTLALLAFVGSGNGFVTTWYDQSGNGRNLTQSTSANQPSIVENSSVINLNSKPVLSFLFTSTTRKWLGTAFNSMTMSPPFSMFATIKLSQVYDFNIISGLENNKRFGISSFSVGNYQPSYTFWGSDNNYIGGQVANLNNSLHYFSTSTSENTRIGVNGQSTIKYITPASWKAIQIGLSDSGPFYCSEVIFFNGVQTANRSNIESNINSYYSIYASDSDAQAFITAAGITDGTQIRAIDTLVTSLKSSGIWSKMKAIYPFVGGSAASHKWNLKDPRDLDAAFRLVFNGGWTHTGTGAKPNGTTGYANTYLNPKNNLAVNSGLGFYSRTNDNSKNQADMGAMYYFPVQAFIIGSGTSLGIFMGSNTSDFISFADSDTRAFYQVYRTSSTTVKSLRNTTSYSNTNLPYSAPNLNVFIGARNEMGLAQDFGLREVAFAYIQENFTDSDANNLYMAVQAYQTTLGRAV